MAWNRGIRVVRSRWVVLAAVLLTIVGGTAGVVGYVLLERARSARKNLRTVVVHRTDLRSEVVASGRLQSALNTEIRCSLEKINAPGRAGGAAGGASIILSLIPDGSFVKEGDVLCRLDASDYEELARQQAIVVQQAQSEHRQAVITLEVTRIQADAFRSAEQLLVTQPLKGQIALGRSDLTRQEDRVDWMRHMAQMGYSSPAQLYTEEFALTRATLGLAELATAFRNYQRYTAPKQIATLESQVSNAEAVLEYQTARRKREEDRLAHYESLIDGCTVRAPHDGLVVYANRPGRDPTVYAGAPVRERLRLFYLPDLSKMEVELMVHETVVHKLKAGMPAKVRVEGLPDREFDGTLSSVSLLPLYDRKSRTGNQVTYFLGRIQLRSATEGLRPGMSAEAAIETEGSHDVLAVPPAAVASQGEQKFCYVVREDGFERRPVEVGHLTPALLEVTDGLHEGEEVLLDAAHVVISQSPSRWSSL